MTFDELLAKYEPAHAAAFRQALEEIKSGIVLRVVVERLERGDINSAIEAMHLEPEAFSALEVALTEALNAGGINAVGELPNLSEPNGARVIWRFGIRRPRCRGDPAGASAGAAAGVLRASTDLQPRNRRMVPVDRQYRPPRRGVARQGDGCAVLYRN